MARRASKVSAATSTWSWERPDWCRSTVARMYSGQLGGGFDPFGGAPPPYLEPGTYTISNGGGGSGANAVGPFQVNHTISVPVFWSNKSTVSPAVRAQGLEITWTGGTSGAFAFIFGTSLDLTTTAGAAFTCLADGSTGSFTVPAAVLLALPPSGIVQSIPTGFLGVGITSEPTPFEASGLDVGFITSSSIDQISVEELDIIYRIPHCVPISAHHKWNFDDLLEKIWEYLALVRM